MQSSRLLSLRPKGKCKSSWVSPIIIRSLSRSILPWLQPSQIWQRRKLRTKCCGIHSVTEHSNSCGFSCVRSVLRSPEFSKIFILQTDASDHGIGAVLSQRDQDGDDHPVAYYSRKLLPRELKTIEKECLAIKLVTHAFCVYLLGWPFTNQTNHCALEWLDRLKDMIDSLECSSPTVWLSRMDTNLFLSGEGGRGVKDPWPLHGHGVTACNCYMLIACLFWDVPGVWECSVRILSWNPFGGKLECFCC